MQAACENDELIESFKSVMNGGSDRLRSLVQESTGAGGPHNIDLEYMRGIACYSLAGLRGLLESTKSELNSIRTGVDMDVMGSNNTLVQDCALALDTVYERDLASVSAKVKALGSFGHLEGVKAFSDEKVRLSILNQHMAELSDFVEIPSMLESCISSGYYSEAVAIFDFFEAVHSSKSNRSSALVRRIQTQLTRIQSSLIRYVECKLSKDNNVSWEEVIKILPVLLRQHGQPNNITLGREIYLMGRVAFFTAQKDKILNKREVNLKEYALLIRTYLCEDIFPIYRKLVQQGAGDSSHITRGMDPVCRFLAKEVNDFKTSLQKPTMLPFLFERGNLLVVSELHACIVGDLGDALRNIHCEVDLNHVFYQLCLSHFVEPRLRPQTILSVFNTDLKGYNWEPFTSLTDSMGQNENIALQLTRHKPLALLHNQFINVLNELRHFPLEAISNKVIDYVDIACAQCFDSIIAANATSAHEHNIMKANFCLVLVKVLEDTLHLLFGNSVDLIIVKSHTKFVTGEPPVEVDRSGNNPPISPSSRTN